MRNAVEHLDPMAAPVNWLADVAHRKDRGSFASLFQHFAPKLKGYLLKMGLSEAVAEELIQETMLTIWRKAAQYDASRASPAAWVFTIARNLRIDTLRRERYGHDPRVLEIAGEQNSPEEDLCSRQNERQLHSALNGLPTGQAEIMRLSFFEERSHNQIAGDLDIPLGTVKSRLRRAAAQLRAALEGRV